MVFARQKNAVAYVVTGVHISLVKSAHSFPEKLHRHVVFACVGDLYLSLVINGTWAPRISQYFPSLSPTSFDYNVWSECVPSLHLPMSLPFRQIFNRKKVLSGAFFPPEHKAALRRRKKGEPHKWATSVMNSSISSSIAFSARFLRIKPGLGSQRP